MSNDNFFDRPTGEVPVVAPADPRVTIEGAVPASELASETTLPHWTEAPTGQVPAVLTREPESATTDPWASVPAPAWREGEADWVAHDEQFDPSVLAPDSPAEESSSWEFGLDDDEEESAEEAPRPEPSRPVRTRQRSANPLAGRAARSTAQKNVSVATLYGALMALVVIVLFTLGSVVVATLVTVVVTAATAEALAAYRKAGAHPATLLGILTAAVLSIATYNYGSSALGLTSIIFVFLGFLWYLSAETKVDMLDGLGATMFVYVWIGVVGSFGALLISPSTFPHKHGLAFLFGAVLCTVANDTGALFSGRRFGNRPLAKTVSPGKTWAGAIGGSLSSLFVGLIFLPLISPWSVGGGLLEALVISVVVPFGDLFESLVKRTLGVKDMGTLIPGHGGILDRVDGLLFALPATYFLMHLLHLG